MRLYMNNPGVLEQAMRDTGLTQDEIEYLVGRFTKRFKHAPGGLRGELVYKNGEVRIIAHKTKRILFRTVVEDNTLCDDHF